MHKRTWVFLAVIVGLIFGGLAYRRFAQDVDSRGATRLMRAIEENDTDKALKLLNTGDINVRDKAGQTALFYAARHATDPKVIYKLLVAGASAAITDKEGNTPLVVAAKYNTSAAVVMALAKQNYRATEQQANKDRALAVAARNNTAAVIKTLLMARANPAAIEPDGRGAATYLVENERLSEQEKADYRQVMLVLEILEAREQFAKNMQRAKPKDLKPVSPREEKKEVSNKEETKPVDTSSSTELEKKKQPSEQSATFTQSLQEKQMKDESPTNT